MSDEQDVFCLEHDVIKLHSEVRVLQNIVCALLSQQSLDFLDYVNLKEPDVENFISNCKTRIMEINKMKEKKHD